MKVLEFREEKRTFVKVKGGNVKFFLNNLIIEKKNPFFLFKL